MNKLLSFAAVILVVIIGAQLASAQTSSNLCTPGAEVNSLKGWAWSSTVGWLSFTSANPGSGGGSYQVCVDGNGNMGGYGWSSNIGWVSFQPSDIAGCPSPTASKVNLTTGVVSGFARAIAGKGRTDGWDGCIALAGPQHVSSLSGKGVFMDATGAFSGFAWGSEVVGWLNFNATADRVICTNECRPGNPTPSPIIASCTFASPQTIPLSNTSRSITLFPSVIITSLGLYDHTPRSFPNIGVGTYDDEGAFEVVVTDRNDSTRSARIRCGAVVVKEETTTASIFLGIGRRPEDANARALAITKGDSFALKWRNTAPGGTNCTTIVTRGGVVDTNNLNWGEWKGQDPANLLGNDDHQAFPVRTNSDMVSGTYRFTLSCNNNTSASVDLILNSSSQIEV